MSHRKSDLGIPLPYSLAKSVHKIRSLAGRYRDFYFQASDGLVALPAAGYDYDIDWTSYVGGTCTRWNDS